MRRSQAPSQVAARQEPGGQEAGGSRSQVAGGSRSQVEEGGRRGAGRKRPKYVEEESEEEDVTMESPVRSPLALLQNIHRAPLIGRCSPLPSSLLSPHEALIRSLLNKPFRVPIAGYTGSGYGRSLGVRRSGGRQPLHDPEAEGSLVLYSPPELSEHERLKVDTLKVPVAVVVDPLLTKLRRLEAAQASVPALEASPGKQEVKPQRGEVLSDPLGEMKKNRRVWTKNEIDIFIKMFRKKSKDFGKIAKKLETKSVKDCVLWYYISKKKLKVKRKPINKASNP